MENCLSSCCQRASLVQAVTTTTTTTYFTTTSTTIATTTGNVSFIAKTSWQGSSLVQLVTDRRNPGRESRGV